MLLGSDCLAGNRSDGENALTDGLPGKWGAAVGAAKAAADSAGGYDKIIKDAAVKEGLFKTIWKAKEGKLYWELEEKDFGRLLMLANRVSDTSNPKDYVAGQMVKSLMFRLSHDEKNVYMHLVKSVNLVEDGDPVLQALDRNSTEPVLKGFKIEDRNGENLVIDVTSFFGANERSISPMKESSPAGKLLGLSEGLKGTFQAEASNICEVKTFESNIEIKSMLTYMVQEASSQQPYTVRMNRSVFALPEEPMRMRLQDDRVGFFHGYKDVYSTSEDRVREQKFIHRWRLEPKADDLERYYAGELVEPMQPIVFYVDSAFPEKWRTAIKEGIEVWNVAFEKAGFKNAIKAVDYPSEDTGFDPDDMRNSCFRYVGTKTANAMGPSYVDPRTGEILSADVIWYHNIVSLLHNWRFVQTSAVDPRVRTAVFADSLMQESIRYAASHEIGHTLGLMHNMGASYAFDVDSLRDVAFTNRYGTTPSIMDYARNNYVAQPGDFERGVKLTPPAIGVYDIYAINWGYRQIPLAKKPEDEKKQLDAWIAEHSGDAKYEFGAQQIMGVVDPTDQTEDLGNDHIKASDLGMSNLRITMSHLTEWAMERGTEYDGIEDTYKDVVRQHDRYVGHVMPYIGGVEFKEIRQGDGNRNARIFISRQKQLDALKWIVKDLRTAPQWLEPKEVINLFEAPVSALAKSRKSNISRLLSPNLLYRIDESARLGEGTPLTTEDYLAELTRQIFVRPTAGQLSDVDRQLQGDALAVMMRQSGLQDAKADAKAKALTDDEEAGMADEAEHFCSFDQMADESRAFTRFNVANGSLPTAEVGALMMGRLKAVKTLYQQYRATATGVTRNFYDYQILLIDRTLKVN